MFHRSYKNFRWRILGQHYVTYCCFVSQNDKTVYFYVKSVLVRYFQYECFINCSFYLFQYVNATACVRSFDTTKVLWIENLLLQNKLFRFPTLATTVTSRTPRKKWDWYEGFSIRKIKNCRSQWPRGLRRRSTAARLLRS